jgi:uncharacterized protein
MNHQLPDDTIKSPESGGPQPGPVEGAETSELRPDGPPAPVNAEPPRRQRGFAAMDRSLVQSIARKGGKAAHATGRAHEFTSEEARVAGHKGGKASHARRRAQRESEGGASR